MIIVTSKKDLPYLDDTKKSSSVKPEKLPWL